MYQLTLLRHGRSLADDEEKYEGRYDSPLTEIGERQARETTKYFIKNKMSFASIITSPLIRAYRTAEIINEAYSLPIITEPLLMERDNGIIAGMKKEELNRNHPLPAFDSPFRYYPEHSGENNVMLHARAGLAVNKIIDLGPGSYLIVSHGGILNAMIRNMLGIPYMVNGSGASYRLNDNGFIVINYYEDQNHWNVIKMD